MNESTVDIRPLHKHALFVRPQQPRFWARQIAHVLYMYDYKILRFWKRKRKSGRLLAADKKQI